MLDLGMNPLAEYQAHSLQEARKMVERRATLRGEPVVVDLGRIGVLGPLLGGTKAQPQPAGRGLLVRRGERPVLIQTAFSPPTPGPGAVASASWTSDRAGDP